MARSVGRRCSVPSVSLVRNAGTAEQRLDEVEGRILEMVNWIGDEMVQEMVAGLTEPTTANQITVSDEIGWRCLSGYINRFGEKVVRAPRCYRYRDRARGVAPLDMKLEIDGYFGFSPLMTFLICNAGRRRVVWRSSRETGGNAQFQRRDRR